MALDSTDREQVARLIDAASVLSSSKPSTPTSDIKDVLYSRLEKFMAMYEDGEGPNIELSNEQTEEDLHTNTANAGLWLLERVQDVLKREINAEPDAPPYLGTRDLAQLRTILSITFKWGIEPLLILSYANPSANEPHPNLTDTTTRLLKLIFPDGDIPQTHLTQTILTRHVTDILRPCIFLGWRKGDGDEWIRACTMRLLSILPSSQTISSVGAVMSPLPSASSAPIPPHVLKTCSTLLSKQLLRPDGLGGLFAAVFGDESDSEVDSALPSLQKLTQISRIIQTPPSSISPTSYYELIVPRLLSTLNPPPSAQQQTIPQSHRRAAAFTLSKLITSLPSSASAREIILHKLHDPFISPSPSTTPLETLTSISSLLTSTDPSPPLLQALMAPILPPLFYLSCFSHISIDPSTKEMARGLMKTWGRVCGKDEVVEGVWDLVRGADGWGMEVDVEGKRRAWGINDDGELVVRELDDDNDQSPLPSLLPSAAPTSSSGIEDLQLRPNPAQLITFLKSINRKEISSALFIRSLDEYSSLSKLPNQDDVNPLRILLYLQLVLTFLQEMGSTILLEKPDYILSFVANLLEPSISSAEKRKEKGMKRGLGLGDLKIVEDSDDEESGDEDAHEDEDEDGSLGVGGGMIPAALTLLLSVLEANANMTPTTTPLLTVISSHLEPLTNSPSQNIRELALEGRLVLTARSASSSSGNAGSGGEKKEYDEKEHKKRKDLEVYQEALRLIQDPLLPVRAYGLNLLRSLVSASPPSLDPALIPSILTIFIQSLDSPDSFIFLNAVQGLCAMTESFGKDILIRLVNEYYSEQDGRGGDMGKGELDRKLRFGEALAGVVRNLGERLSLYVNVIIPPLVRTFQSTYLPTSLRTSSISILGQCVDTAPLALLPWLNELVAALIDLLQLEGVSRQPPPKSKQDTDTTNDGKGKGKDVSSSDLSATETEPMDSTPLSTSTKLSPFRRSALHFLALLLRSSISSVYSSATKGFFDNDLAKRLKVVLGYVRATDEDGVVRVMAGECLELGEQLGRARLGLAE